MTTPPKEPQELREQANEIAKFISYANRATKDHWRKKNGAQAIIDLCQAHSRQAVEDYIRNDVPDVIYSFLNTKVGASVTASQICRTIHKEFRGKALDRVVKEELAALARKEEEA